ncbi:MULTISPECIES: hypothetical protein [Pseudomonas]|uniref:Uncharacterized protein n=1 Tax=Pseudomonas quercus TaxID=2722792 RepID=A0ABX0YJX4_9PSED|nr:MULTISPECIES: hypothetical protein [Pseudomonas]MBF7143647.1 hypothetical protein [Pseudomonas sp. LY10J]NJP02313.1 hypothetical protein [Pseudomonas quercus]
MEFINRKIATSREKEMKRQELSDLLKEILVDLRGLEAIRGGCSLYSIISSYEDTLVCLAHKRLKNNHIKHAPREYLEVYNDYKNPLLERMDLAQRKVKEFIELDH